MTSLRWLILATGIATFAGFGAACDSPSDDGSSAGGDAAGVGGTGGAGGTGGQGGSGGATGGMGAGGQGGSDVCSDPNGLPVFTVAPPKLSDTGLYDDILTQTLAGYALPYAPAYELWSDGSAKSRWIYLPDCTIDTFDMDHWVLPVGTRLWKQFDVAGNRVETRLMHRFGPGESDWLFAVYQWNATLTDADLVTGGVVDANGTSHNIPSANDCRTCHDRVSERALGFAAIQLSHAGPGETMATLSASGRLTIPAPAGFPVPGNAVEQAAIGYLHANCGNCHNQQQFDTFFSMRLSVTQLTVAETDVVNEAVGVPVSNPIGQYVTHRIAPANPPASGALYRLGLRDGTVNQMPPLASEIAHPAGYTALETWIVSMGQ